ncbi:9615_t:CDS:1, partial [Funneliformis caledonium]
ESGWEDENWVNEGTLQDGREVLVNLVWKDNAVLNKRKRGPYLAGPIKKSTYYDKWGPNGTFTIAASNTKDITGYFFSTKDSNNNISSPDTADIVLEFSNNRNEED